MTPEYGTDISWGQKLLGEHKIQPSTCQICRGPTEKCTAPSCCSRGAQASTTTYPACSQTLRPAEQSYSCLPLLFPPFFVDPFSSAALPGLLALSPTISLPTRLAAPRTCVRSLPL